ncbi:MAG: hypothetical protein PHV16_04560 [Candidatus Nanoarchaeia archaeon]|nr:hypothetical protein [Candidatus Nanoarchaeia archaeon]
MEKIVFLLVFVFLISGCSNVPDDAECTIDSDCVPATCCHPTECVPREQAQDCSAVLCSMECVPGTLDCGQGSCECIDYECRAVFQ